MKASLPIYLQTAVVVEVGKATNLIFHLAYQWKNHDHNIFLTSGLHRPKHYQQCLINQQLAKLRCKLTKISFSFSTTYLIESF